MNTKIILVSTVLILLLSGLSGAAQFVYASSPGVYTASNYHEGFDWAKIYITSGTYYAETSSDGKAEIANNPPNLGEATFRNSLVSYSEGIQKYDNVLTHDLYNIDTGGAYMWFSTPSNYKHTTHQFVGTSANTTYLTTKSDISVSLNIHRQANNFYYSTITVILYTDTPKKINGTTSCIDNVTKYVWVDDAWSYMEINDTDVSNYYEFDVINNTDYKLVFSDGHEYEFACTGTNITYNYSGCTLAIYDFRESCGNLIPDSEGYYCMDWYGGGGFCKEFYTPNGSLDIGNEIYKSITFYTNSFIGQKWWYISSVLSNHTYNCFNTALDWRLKVVVQNESDGTLIDGALVKVGQDCYCTHDGCTLVGDVCTCGGISVRQKMTINGAASFSEMSLQDATLFISKDGYKTLDISSTNYSDTLSGRSNFSSKTWLVKLAPLSSDNESAWYEPQNRVNIHFRNADGNRTSKILDTDAQVYLYYENNNTNEEDMTLKFQSSSTHTHFIDEQSWNIPQGEIGHKTISNTYFTPWDYSYRAIIYNSSIYGWNMTIPLTVRNTTKEEELHYENLTTNLWFMYTDVGRIDYREDMRVVIHAGSNNTTLLTIDVELWKDNVYTDCKNLTAPDFINADFPYYYVWNPAYNYVSGSNYSIRMYGFDRTLLETDYVECYTDNITRKNKLTIIVKNQYGTNVDNAFVYLEDYGSIPTGAYYYASFEGLDNGYYRFKASKPDYVGTGWSDITLSDNDETITYVLTGVSGETGTGAQTKMSDTTLRNLYIPIMCVLLILILFGGLKDVL